tara:strand:- start:1746 stop:2897 length:1152 start_codon:yes stop_codon:yes gene_type:complete
MGFISSIGAFSSARNYFDQLKKDRWTGVDRAGNVGSRPDDIPIRAVHNRQMNILGGIELLSRFRPAIPKSINNIRQRFAPILPTTNLGKAANVAINAARLASNLTGLNTSLPSYANTNRFTVVPALSKPLSNTLKKKYGLSITDHSFEKLYGFFDSDGNFQNHTYQDLVNVSFNTDTDQTCVRGIIAAFTDTVTPTWNETTYVGRPDAMVSYGGFTREVSFDLTLAAVSAQSLRPMYVQINKIADLVLPRRDYKAIGARYSGNLVNVTVGSYLRGELAACTGVTITPNEECPWEILDPDVDYPQTGFSKNATLTKNAVLDLVNAAQQKHTRFQNAAAATRNAFKVPRVVTINLAFKILHNEIPGVGNRPMIYTNTNYDIDRIA